MGQAFLAAWLFWPDGSGGFSHKPVLAKWLGQF
jgi:hypothetical protein